MPTIDGQTFGFKDRRVGPPLKTSRYAVEFSDGRQRIKLLSEPDADELRELGARVTKVSRLRSGR